MKNKLAFLYTIIIIFVTGCTVNKVNTTPRTSATPSPISISSQVHTPSPTLTPVYDQTYDTDPCWMDPENISISISHKQNYGEIMKALWSKYLDHFVSCQSPSYWKINDYEITKTVVVSTEPRIFVWILYSVKPSQELSWFFSGNGKFDEKTGWFAQGLCYELIKDGYEYHLGKGGTMC